jgi:hypothetical protein
MRVTAGWLLAFAVATAAAAAPGRARADDAPPWARGVTDAQKQAAQKLLDDGNSRFVEHDYVAALAKYRAAIAIWDHPAIRFNVVRCLIQLDRPLEADDALVHALAYGSAPLEDSVYSEALAYGKLLANEIGHLALSCTEAGAELALDGKPALACPGTHEYRVAPGAHTVIGTRVGFAPQTTRVVVVGGQHEAVAVSLVPIELAVTRVRRWAAWKPWVVAGAGLGVAGLGALVDYQASRDMASYDAQLVMNCRDTGCSPSHPITPQLVALEHSARSESALGVTALGIGAAAALAGGTLLYLNRERLVSSTGGIAAAAVPERGGAAVVVSGRF